MKLMQRPKLLKGDDCTRIFQSLERSIAFIGFIIRVFFF